MAVTISNSIPQQGIAMGNMRGRVVDIALTATTDYLTNGTAITPSQVNLNEIYGATFVGFSAGTTAAKAQQPKWDQANLKIMLFVGAAGVDVEQTNAANIIVTMRWLFVGVGV